MKGGAEKKIKGGFRPSRGARVTSVRGRYQRGGYVRPMIFNPGIIRMFYIFTSKIVSKN